jgi:hypothetical protein
MMLFYDLLHVLIVIKRHYATSLTISSFLNLLHPKIFICY